MDLFCSDNIYQVTRHYSAITDKQAVKKDALLASTWPDFSYAFPPQPLVSKFLEWTRLSTSELPFCTMFNKVNKLY